MGGNLAFGPETMTTNNVYEPKRVNVTTNIEEIIKIHKSGGKLSFFQSIVLQAEMLKRKVSNTAVVDDSTKTKSKNDLSTACQLEPNENSDREADLAESDPSSDEKSGKSKFSEEKENLSTLNCYQEEAEGMDDVPDVPTSNCYEKSKPIVDKDLQCPVCFNKTFKDEILLSNHVEECLSKQAISSLLKDEASTYSSSSKKGVSDKNKKRKANEDKKKTDKRCKVEASKNHRIDTFFKLKSRSADLKL